MQLDSLTSYLTRTDNSASILADNGCMGVIEGANSPCTKGAKYIFRNRGMLLGPYKVSGNPLCFPCPCKTGHCGLLN
jgi:hypothetical protein